jgi:hypothetical protein
LAPVCTVRQAGLGHAAELKKIDSQYGKYFFNNFNLNGIPFAGIPVSFIT